ncbi:MAG: hypothetical protein AB8B78_13815 [Polaribacter sp.]
MKKILVLLLILCVGCKKNSTNNDNYQLFKAKNSEALLILFPGGGSTAKETKRDFKILEKAKQNNISVLLMNFNRHLWIEDDDSEKLEKLIKDIVDEHNLNTDNIFIGGMSIGGTVALSLSSFLAKNNSKINPKGVFVVDSPIDLYALYESSQKDLLRKDFSEERLGEPKWIISYFEEKFGVYESLLANIQKVAPITLKTENTSNIDALKYKKLRFYVEPDTLWYQQNRQTDFESTNAFALQKTTALLEDKNWKKTTLIQTKNKGFTANGERNPHSWSIVNVDDLIKWILK